MQYVDLATIGSKIYFGLFAENSIIILFDYLWNKQAPCTSSGARSTEMD